MAIFGITGHQRLTAETERLVQEAIRDELASAQQPLTGVTSLAEGADQIFAAEVLRHEGELIVIVPSDNYDRTFTDEASLRRYEQLLHRASEARELPFEEPSEQAFMAAGREVVDASDVLIAVWDGRPARGVGGTADVVAYARGLSKPVIRIWPANAARTT